MNLGKRGASLSLGGRGLSVNLGGRGVRTTVGLPGTGLSYTTSTKAGKLPHQPDKRDEKIDIHTDNFVEQTDQSVHQPVKVDNQVDDFQYSDENSSGLNLFLTTMALVFIGGSAIAGLLYLFYYLFLIP